MENKEKLKVAAYIRVSTEMEIQENSFGIQERYFVNLINSNPDWVMAGIYSDEGITGTNKNKRIGFQRLIRHCEEGRIDKVICKSLSRFARNTLDSLEAIRHLKDLGISIYFEKEAIDTMSLQSEFILSTLAAVAQEESRSISENLLMSYKQRCKTGDVKMPRLFGFRTQKSKKNRNQVIIINEEEAQTVRYIYQSFYQGKKMKEIADDLICQGIKDISGTINWTSSSIRRILINEKYAGDFLTHKTYTADSLSHKTKWNKGEVEQHLITNHHKAIVDKELWEAVQPMLKKNKPYTKTVRYLPFTGRIRCAECGHNFQKTAKKYYISYECGRRLKSPRLCQAEAISERYLMKNLVSAFVVRFDKDGILEPKKLLDDLRMVHDFDNVEGQRVVLKRQIAISDEPLLKARFEQKLKNLERLWEMLEKDRQCRTEAINWLKECEVKGASSDEILKEITPSRIRAWVTEVTISQDEIKVLWLNGSTDVINRKKRGKK